MRENGTNKNLRASIVLSYVSMFLGIFVSILYTPFMLRSLGQQQYGLYNMAASAISYLNLFDLGLGNAVVRYSTKYRVEKRYVEAEYLYGMFVKIFGAISLLTLLIGTILIVNIDHIYTVSTGAEGIAQIRVIMILMVISLAVSFPGSVFGSIITSYEEFSFLKITTMISTILNPIIMIPLLVLGYKATAMASVVLLLNIVLITCNAIFVHKKLKIRIRFGKMDKSLLKEISGYSGFIFLAAIVDQLYWNTDKIILGARVGEVSVAVYSVGSQIHTYFQQFSWSISNVFFPKITKMVFQDSKEALYRFFLKVGRIQFFVLFMIYSGFLIFGKEFIQWWAGDGYQSAYYIAVMVITGAIIPLIQNTGVHIVQAMNKHAFRSICYFAIAVLNAISSYFLAVRWQGIGCAFCTLISLLLGHGLAMNWYYKNKLGLDIVDFWKNICLIVVKYLPLVIVSYFANTLYTTNDILFLLFKIVIYVIFYAMLTYFLNMNHEEREIVLGITRKVLKK